MKLESTAFKDGERIPKKYTCDGENISPPLSFKDVPSEARRLVLIVEDIDSFAGIWVHWIAWNIHPDSDGIPEGTLPSNIKEGTNSFQNIGYGGPCPQDGEHRYYFRLYALDERFRVDEGMDWSEYEVEMAGHVVDRADLMGTYSRE